MRSSFVDHGAQSLLSTAIVSLSRTIYLPALRSTVITRFIANMAGSDFHGVVSDVSCVNTWSSDTSSFKDAMDLLGSVAHLYKLADA